MKSLWDERYTPADAELIRSKTRKLVQKHRYRRSDQEDLEQKLAMHLWKRMKNYSPEIGDRRAFVHTILENEIANMITHDTALKRDVRRERPLPDGAAEIFPDKRRRHDADLRMDIDSLIKCLPSDLQSIARQRMFMAEAEFTELTGMTRGKIRQRMQEIAKDFASKGWP